MKKTTTTKRKTVKTARTSKVSKRTAAVAPVKRAPVVKQAETPVWMTIVAVLLILIGYTVYRFWSIATVNGVSISRYDHYKLMNQQMGQQTLDNMITEALIFDAAKNQNYVVDENQIDEKIASIETQITAQGQTLDEALALENVTLSEVRRQFALQQIVDALGQGEVAVSQEEIDQYIADNQANMPEGMTAEEAQDLVKTQLESQQSNTNINTWLEDLRTNAVIVQK